MNISKKHIPNMISGLRVVLVIPIIWSLLSQKFELAIVLFIIAGISDGVDGFLAKRFGWHSRIGGILDALADKFLLISTFLCLWLLHVFPGWFVFWILLRDLMIVFGGIFYNLRVAKFHPKPSLISKFNTFLQIILAALGVLHLGLYSIPAWLLDIFIYTIAFTVLLSGMGYIKDWVQGVGVNDITQQRRKYE
tara:strand:+ start:230 stop:808 length:579 start_codon:yes stop_codon:yes gene_type:complete